MSVKKDPRPKSKEINVAKLIYRVFHVIGHQEQGCCEHVLCLMNALRGSM